MEVRKCRYCSGTIPAEKRADTKFCSNSCKANYWEENKEKQKAPQTKAIQEKEKPKVPEKPLDGLRGVVENKPKIDVTAVKEPSKLIENEQITPAATKIETHAYKEALAKREKAESDYQRIRKTLTDCEKAMLLWSKEKEKLKYVKSTNRFKARNVDAMAIQDNFLEEVWESDNRNERQKEAEKKIALFTGNKSKLERMLPAAKKIYDEAEQKLKSIPQYEPVKQKPVVFASGLMKGIGQIKLRQEEPKPEQTEIKQEEEKSIGNRAEIQSNSKLISSRELREMNYKCLNFQGRWSEFFGLPAVVFHLAVHGKPGEGKSTFCIQFADYLAKNFGHVVYVSGEEGFSKTLRDKVVNNKIDNPYLFFADISSFEQIQNEIENNKFHFIFIDSLDTLKIDAARLRELREHYPQSAIITISQSTKDGKMRGSQEIIHDCDIAVRVENGMAITTKNRYEERGREFQVFSAMEKPTGRKMAEVRNII